MADAATAEISRAKSANGSDIVPSSRTVAPSIRPLRGTPSAMSSRNSGGVPPTAAATTTRPSHSVSLSKPDLPRILDFARDDHGEHYLEFHIEFFELLWFEHRRRAP